MPYGIRCLFILGALMCSWSAAAAVYQEPRAFLLETFGGTAPPARLLWITSKEQAVIDKILGHELSALRVRYWRAGETSAWILQEIGKEQPITTGIVVNRGRIQRIKVLIYRESRGWEVRYPFFTDQFRGARLDAKLALNRSIDGISGATLSVRAIKKLARLALYFDQQTLAKP